MESDASHSGRTALHRNAFYVLGASLDDTRRDITRLAAQKSLLLSETAVRRARTELTQPRSRLAAEVGWLPGVPQKVIEQLLDDNRLDSDILRYAEVPSLSQANAYAAMFEERLAKQQQMEWASYDLPAFAPIVDCIDAAQITELLNTLREKSGFPALDVAQVREALQDHRRYYLYVCNHVLQRLGLVSRRVVLLKALEESADDARLIHDLVDEYDLEQTTAIAESAKAIEELANRIEQDPASNSAPLFQLKNRLPQFARVVQPILQSRTMRGLDHQLTTDMVWKLRSTAVDIANDHNAFETSYVIVTGIRDAFSAVSSVQGIVANDIEHLDRIIQDERHLRAAHASLAASQPSQPDRLQSISSPIQQSSKAWNQKKSGGWAIIAAVAALLLIANVFSSDANNSGTAKPSGFEEVALVTEPSDRDRCDGVDEWWDGTNDRIGQSNRIIDGLGTFDTNANFSAAQRQLSTIAREQRMSDPPSAAVELNRLQTEIYELIAARLTDTTLTDAEYDKIFGELEREAAQEADAVGDQCGFDVIHE